MKKMLKPLAILASAFLIGSLLPTSALWEDKEEIDYSVEQGHARLDLIVDGQTHEVIREDGTSDIYKGYSDKYYTVSGNVRFAETELFTDDDIRELGTNRRLAKPITVDAETTKGIGLASYSLLWKYDSLNYGFSKTGTKYNSWNVYEEDPRLTFKQGTLLKMTEPEKNKIVDVENPAECTTDLFNESLPHTSLLSAHVYGDQREGLPITKPNLSYTRGNFALGYDNYGIGADERKTDTICMLLALPDTGDPERLHKNTITVEGTGTITGETIEESDTFTAGIEEKFYDYAPEVEAQLGEEKIKIALYLQRSEYNSGNYSYKDYLGDKE